MPRKYQKRVNKYKAAPKSFNEAGADAPEIPCDETEEALCSHGFNEAGADAPEIQDDLNKQLTDANELQ